MAVEAGAGEGASHPDSEYSDAGAKVGEDPWGADVVLKVTPPTDEEVGRLKQGQILIGFLEPLTNPDLAKSLGQRGRHELRHGGDPPDHPRPVDGRALLAGEPRRLHVGADRRARVRQALPDDDHGGGDDPAGQGPGPRRRGRGPAGDRDGQAARRRGHRLRRPLGRQGAGPVARRPLPRGRGRQGRRGRGRLRAAAHRGGEREASAGARRGRQAPGRDHHDRADPRPARAAPDHRRGRQEHGARLGAHRPRRRDRRQRRGLEAGRDRRGRRGQDHRPGQPAEPDGRQRLGALRQEPAEPGRAADRRRGQPQGRHRGRGHRRLPAHQGRRDRQRESQGGRDS